MLINIKPYQAPSISKFTLVNLLYTTGDKVVRCYFTRDVDFTWSVSDCEELVGGYSQEMNGVGYKSNLIIILSSQLSKI